MSFFEDTLIWLELSDRDERLFREVWNRLPPTAHERTINRLQKVTDQDQLPKQEHGRTRSWPGYREISLKLDKLDDLDARYVIAHELIHAMFDEAGMTNKEEKAAETWADGIAVEFGFPPEEGIWKKRGM